MGNVFPSYAKDYVKTIPAKLYLKPCESGEITVSIMLDKNTFRSKDSLGITFIGMDNKYQYVDPTWISMNIDDPKVDNQVEQVIQENTENYYDNVGQPQLPTESTGSLFEDVKLAIRAKAFGPKATAQLDSLVDMYSTDPEGEKNLLTALAVIGLFPEDKIQSVLTIYSAGPKTIGELTYEVAKESWSPRQKMLLNGLWIPLLC